MKYKKKITQRGNKTTDKIGRYKIKRGEKTKKSDNF